MKYLSKTAERLTPYVAGIQPQEGGWVKLNTNENPYPPSDKVIQAITRVRPEKLRLYPDLDSSLLKSAIARTLEVESNNVFVGNGSDEVLALAFAAYFGGKQNILMPDISYGFYPVWSDMFGANSRFVPLNDKMQIDPNDYCGAGGVVIANPNAPTGTALDLPAIEAIASGNPSGVVIVDEAYIDFSRIPSAASVIDKYDNLIVTRTFSKAYSLAGLRVGFAVANKKLIDGLNLVKNAFNSYPLDALAQTGAAAAIADKEHLKATTARIIAARDRTIATLRGLGCTALDSQTNFIFVQTPLAKELYEYLLAKKILVRYWDKPRISDSLRISVGTDAQMKFLTDSVGEFFGRRSCV